MQNRASSKWCTFVVIAFCFFGTACRTRKFGQVNAWETSENRQKAVSAISDIVKTHWGEAFKVRKQEINESELSLLANEFAEKMIDQNPPVSIADSTSKPGAVESGATRLEDYYNAYVIKANPSDQGDFVTSILGLFALKTNLAFWLNGKESKLTMVKDSQKNN